MIGYEPPYIEDHEYAPHNTEPCCRVCGRSPLEHPFPIKKEDE
jgi:hypothetical protein